MPLISVPIAAGGDDGFWDSDGGFDSSLTSALMGRTSTGTIRRGFFRFQNVEIPTGQIIFTARIRFISATNNSSSPQFTVVGENADDPAAVTSASDANGRTRTTATVNWSGLSPWSQGSDYVTPNIAAIIQEIHDRPGWSEGDAIQLFVEGDPASNGTARSAATFDHSTFDAAVLEIFYGSTQHDTGWVDFSSFSGTQQWLTGSSSLRSWTDPGNAAESDDSYAVRASQASTNVSAVLAATTAGIDLPDGAEILGIEVRAEAKYNAANAANIVRVGLTKTGTSLAGTEKLVAQTITDTDTYWTFGSDSDLWGTTWDAADIEASGFGWGFNVNGSGGTTTVECDHMQIRVHYVSTADLLRVADVSVALQAIGIEREAGVSLALAALGLQRDAGVSAALRAEDQARDASVAAALLAMFQRSASVAAALAAFDFSTEADVALALQLLDIQRDAGVDIALSIGGSRDVAVLVALLAEFSRDAAVAMALRSLVDQHRDAGVAIALQALGLSRDAGVAMRLTVSEFLNEHRDASVSMALTRELIPVTSPALGSGRPSFFVAFCTPLPAAERTAAVDVNPRITALTFGSQLPGGWSQARIGMMPEHLRTIRAYLPKTVDAPLFGHVEIRADGDIVWEGRVMDRERPGGFVRGVTADGYGLGAMNDDWVRDGASELITSGQALIEAVRRAAEAVSLDVFEDPMIGHTLDEFVGSTPGQIVQQLTREGGDGVLWDWMVYHGRRAQFVARRQPEEADYRIPVDETVILQDSVRESYGRVTMRFRGPAGQEFTPELRRPGFEEDFIRRAKLLSGSASTAGLAIAFVETWLAEFGRPRVSATVERDYDRGMELYRGGERPAWHVRAGETVEIDGLDPPVLWIERAQFDATAGRAQFTLGASAFGRLAEQRRQVIEATHALRNDRDPMTGSLRRS